MQAPIAAARSHRLRPRARPRTVCTAAGAAGRPAARRSGAGAARRIPTPKDWITLKKQVLVSVDRAETRVALLEANGTPGASRSSASTRSRKRASGALQAGYRIAE